MQNISQQLVNAIVLSALQGPDIATSSIQVPQSWPSSAKLGVEYKLHDRQFPQVRNEYTTVYFDHVGELLAWMEEKRAWIESTDNDFSMTYSVYTWDWGPLFKYTKSM